MLPEFDLMPSMLLFSFYCDSFGFGNILILNFYNQESAAKENILFSCLINFKKMCVRLINSYHL